MKEEEVRKITNDFRALQAHVSKWEDAERMLAKTLDKFGRIDMLVSNAGVLPAGHDGTKLAVMEIAEDGRNSVIDTNLNGPFDYAKALSASMMAQRSSKIVNLRSSRAFSGLVASVPYAPVKTGVFCMLCRSCQGTWSR